MEDSFVTISRAKGSVTYPASFLGCGCKSLPVRLLWGSKRSCTCFGVIQISEKNLGPILDRIDIHVDVPSVETQN